MAAVAAACSRHETARAVAASWRPSSPNAPRSRPSGPGCSTRPSRPCGSRAARTSLTLSEALNRLSDPKEAQTPKRGRGPECALAAHDIDPGPGAQHRRGRQGGGGPLARLQTPCRSPPPGQRGRRRGGRCDGRGGGRGLSEAVAPLLRAEGQGAGQGERWTTGTATRPLETAAAARLRLDSGPGDWCWRASPSWRREFAERGRALLRPALDRRPGRGRASSRVPTPIR